MSQPTPPPYEPAEGHSSPVPPAYGQPAGLSQPGTSQGYGQQGYGQQPYGGSYPATPEAGYGAGYGQGGYAGSPPRRSNTMAMISLISGIVGLTLLPFVGSIVAVITGMMARKEIARTGEEGAGLALAGLITGWVGIGIVVVVLLFILVVFGGMAAAISSVDSY